MTFYCIPIFKDKSFSYRFMCHETYDYNLHETSLLRKKYYPKTIIDAPNNASRSNHSPITTKIV